MVTAAGSQVGGLPLRRETSPVDFRIPFPSNFTHSTDKWPVRRPEPNAFPASVTGFAVLHPGIVRGTTESRFHLTTSVIPAIAECDLVF